MRQPARLTTLIVDLSSNLGDRGRRGGRRGSGEKRIKYSSPMSWKASARHGVREAPAGLALLQDLLNTRGSMSYAPDLLGSPDDAQRWLTEALATWSRVA